jgi:hypothetical protein
MAEMRRAGRVTRSPQDPSLPDHDHSQDIAWLPEWARTAVERLGYQPCARFELFIAREYRFEVA